MNYDRWFETMLADYLEREGLEGTIRLDGTATLAEDPLVAVMSGGENEGTARSRRVHIGFRCVFAGHRWRGYSPVKRSVA